MSFCAFPFWRGHFGNGVSNVSFIVFNAICCFVVVGVFVWAVINMMKEK